MPCYGPMTAWQPRPGAQLVWSERDSAGGRELQIPCGQCIGCRLDRSLQWAVRCLHESQMHAFNTFITLTYDDQHIPPTGALEYPHFQRFIKRARKKLGNFRYYAAGEYGENNDRPHWHACLFGMHLPDTQVYRRLDSGATLYRSNTLDELWKDRHDKTPKGFTSAGSVTFESAAYVARYCVKKVTGPKAVAHYERMHPYTGEITSLTPEFNRMSLKPAIGKTWFDQYFKTDIANRDQITLHDGRKTKVPKYYDKLAAQVADFDIDYTKFLREERARANAAECTPQRLAVREHVTLAKHNANRRKL